MTTKKHKSRMLRKIHEMANDLHEIGLIDNRRMREFDVLCQSRSTGKKTQAPKQLKPIPVFANEQEE